MAQSFYPTIQQVADAAIKVCAAADPESNITPSTTQREDAMQAANFLVTSWIAHGMQVWCQKQGNHTLTASTNSYTAGPSGDISIARPLSIQQAWLRDTVADPDMDLPLRIISREEYNMLSQKAATGTPNCLFYDPQYDLPGSNSGASAKGKIFIWPTPDSSVVTQYDLYFVYTRPIQDFAATSDTLDFPQEWFNAVKWNLAMMIAPEYEVPLGKWKEIQKIAEDTLRLALSWDRETTSVEISPAQQ